jgi:hypothetical protein
VRRRTGANRTSSDVIRDRIPAAGLDWLID